MASPIENYALLSDTESAALVGRDGSIDWLTFPRFDSPACFAALLGTEENGRWRIAPVGEITAVERAYRPGTLVLDTTFHTPTGSVMVTDCMPVRGDCLDLVRLVRGLSGTVELRMDLTVRMDYGAVVPWTRRTPEGLILVAGPDALVLRTPVPTHGVDLSTTSSFRVAADDEVPFHLAWYPSHLDAPGDFAVVDAIATTEAWWREWSDRCTVTGDYADDVRQSMVVLKGLTYRPTGGIVAAATTSLPESIGGERNWDYRYCWLRDATFTLLALLSAGYTEEAVAWRDWLLRTVAGSADQVQIMYGPAGERRLTELELDWLPGYEGSRPVRIGNGAHQQFQLDVFGEVLDAVHQANMLGVPFDAPAWELQCELLGLVERAWREPDDGIWEVRGGRRHFTHSKVMAWVAVDRVLKSAEAFGITEPVPRWRTLCGEIHADVLANGVGPDGAFVQTYGSTALDASLLLVPIVGFLPPDDPRVVRTVERIQAELTVDGLVQRYQPDPEVEGLSGREGTFLMCSFWLADALVLIGRPDEGRALFERLLALRNDVGLLSEQYDPVDRRLLGNFPQAFSHVSLVSTALNLSHTDGPSDARRRSADGD